MQNIPSHEELDALPQALKDVVLHPEFQSLVAEIHSLPASERSQAASTQLTREALAARGIPISGRVTIATHASQFSFVGNHENAHIAGKLTELGVRICIPNRVGADICFP